MSDILLKAKWVLPIDQLPLSEGAVVVSGGKIKSVGKVQKLEKQFPTLKVRDFGHAVLMPGFVDLHTHLAYSVFRGACDDLGFVNWKIQLTERSRNLESEDWKNSAYLGVLEAIECGITTLADITATPETVEAMTNSGLSGRIYYQIVGMDPDAVDKVIDKSKRELEKWRSNSNSLVEFGLAPHSPYSVCPTLYQSVGVWARKELYPLATHLSATIDECQFVKYASSSLAGSYRQLMGWEHLLWQPTGVTPIKYLEQWDVFEGETLAVHCVHVNRNDLDILEKYDVAIAHCPRCNAKLGMGIASLDKFRHRHLRVGLGTDSPASVNTMDLFDEMRAGLLLQRGFCQSSERFSAKSFIELATLRAAEALGKDDEIGSLTVGKRADIIAVDLSHSYQVPATDPYSALVYTANQEDVFFSMVAGKVLYENGKYYTLDENEIVEKAEISRRKLI
jgi:5-methylthioadenosine/S-adenosylhomocysteine deaminase